MRSFGAGRGRAVDRSGPNGVVAGIVAVAVSWVGDGAAEQPLDHPVDAAEVDDQHAADECVDELELPGVLAVEMVVNVFTRLRIFHVLP